MKQLGCRGIEFFHAIAEPTDAPHRNALTVTGTSRRDEDKTFLRAKSR
jgi:hypothetical protein